MARSRDGFIFILGVTLDILLKNCFIDVVLKAHAWDPWHVFMDIER